MGNKIRPPGSQSELKKTMQAVADDSQQIIDQQPAPPGIGQGGAIFCPLIKTICLKNGCAFWVELNYGPNKVGKCSIAMAPILMVELRQEVERLRLSLTPEKK